MKHKKTFEISGTFLQGYVQATKAELVSVFGEPLWTYGEEEKVTIEWGLLFEDQTIATIYDWKRYEQGTPANDELMTYNVGGLTPRAVDLVKKALATK